MNDKDNLPAMVIKFQGEKQNKSIKKQFTKHSQLPGMEGEESYKRYLYL